MPQISRRARLKARLGSSLPHSDEWALQFIWISLAKWCQPQCSKSPRRNSTSSSCWRQLTPNCRSSANLPRGSKYSAKWRRHPSSSCSPKRPFKNAQAFAWSRCRSKHPKFCVWKNCVALCNRKTIFELCAVINWMRCKPLN
ncbi:unnamed protein product [Blepharisma stoltei]|uniref:Uncharacterized protein n=1 Tax=Blepharisma stoltei TaxID=1481888 RepID=A0AAU9JBV2_9CILI|nr:unnamed protein product [Blepharisma stoltei]